MECASELYFNDLALRNWTLNDAGDTKGAALLGLFEEEYQLFEHGANYKYRGKDEEVLSYTHVSDWPTIPCSIRDTRLTLLFWSI